MNNVFKITAVAALIFTSQVFAHAGLESSIPKNGAMLSNSPESLQLNFNKEINLVKLVVMTKEGKDINLNFKPSMNVNTHFIVDMPTLSAGEYNVHWTAMGKDGHKMKGTYAFMVHTSKNSSSKQSYTSTERSTHSH